MSWFEVDKGGLQQLLEGKNKSFVLRELIQNAWDEPGVTQCVAELIPVPNHPQARIAVEDDAPEGFYDLRHAYTLFADTRKRKDAEKRGRFNMGEKQVLALCKEAEIVTTKGTVIFKADGKRVHKGAGLAEGSIFKALLPMTRAEFDDCVKAVRTFLPPKGIKTILNAEEIPYRKPLKVVKATLETEHTNGDGLYRSTRRKTKIHIHEPLPGEEPMIYEMGLPVVETGDKWHYDIQQRVPLTADRDNVKPSFLRDVRSKVLDAMAEQIQEEDVSNQWVRDATPKVCVTTAKIIADKRWGSKRVVADPTDPKSRERAIAAGYHLVHAREMSKAEWAKMREAEAVPASSALFPTMSTADWETIPEESWKEGERKLAALTKRIADLGINKEVTVRFIRCTSGSNSAEYGNHTLTYNVSRLGRHWYGKNTLEDVTRLIIHELGHEYGGHLEERYYNGLARIGARLAQCTPKEIFG